jgi:hypothetical protein
MIASVFIYLGALLATLGLVAAVLPRRLRGRRGRTAGPLAALTGIGLGLLGFGMPIHEVIVEAPRERLDAVLPRYQFHERHELVVAAPPLAVDQAIRAVTADEIRLYRSLTAIRRLGRRGPESLLDAPSGVPMLELATRTGFHLLADEPGHEIVLGVALPVSLAAQESARAAVRRDGRRPFLNGVEGYATSVMNFRVTPDGRGGSVVSTETRVFAPDSTTRWAFARYWRLIYPGSALIRRAWLDAIRRRAEGAAARSARPTGQPVAHPSESQANQRAHDRRGHGCAGCQTRPPDPVGRRLVHAMAEEDVPQPGRQVREDAQGAECVMRQQPDVPGVE